MFRLYLPSFHGLYYYFGVAGADSLECLCLNRRRLYEVQHRV